MYVYDNGPRKNKLVNKTDNNMRKMHLDKARTINMTHILNVSKQYNNISLVYYSDL